jgi:hypothetical protein
MPAPNKLSTNAAPDALATSTAQSADADGRIVRRAMLVALGVHQSLRTVTWSLGMLAVDVNTSCVGATTVTAAGTVTVLAPVPVPVPVPAAAPTATETVPATVPMMAFVPVPVGVTIAGASHAMVVLALRALLDTKLASLPIT